MGWINFNNNLGQELKKCYEEKHVLTEDEVRELTYDPDEEVEEGSGRWTSQCIALYKYEDKWYGVTYEQGLTEYQDNYYPDQVPKLYEKVEIKTYVFKEVG